MNSILVLICIAFCFYLNFILSLLRSNKKAKGILAEDISISVIIPFRNEAKVIRKRVDNLLSLNSDNIRMEIILVNDHSEDEFREEIKDLLSEIKLIDNEGHGKKNAIRSGVAHATNDYLLFSDADVVHKRDFLQSLKKVLSTESDLLVLPIEMTGAGPIAAYQKIENSSSLAMNYAYFLKHSRPLLASGANLLCRRSTYLSIDPHGDNLNVSSGDDQFLLEALIQKGSKVDMEMHPDLVASTAAERVFSKAVDQRLRWMTKMKFLKGSAGFKSGGMVALGQILLALSFIIALYNFSYFFFFIILLLMKSLVDHSLLRKIKNRGHSIPSFLSLILFEFVYMLSLPLLLILSIFRTPKWKGRKVDLSLG